MPVKKFNMRGDAKLCDLRHYTFQMKSNANITQDYEGEMGKMAASAGDAEK
jgi:hypothetical protein